MESVTAGMGPALAYTVGIDIGQKRDPTAIAVVEVRERTTGQLSEAIHITRHLERLPLGTSYPKIAERLAVIVKNAQQEARQQHFEERGVSNPSEFGFAVYIDATGVGQPVVDILAETGLDIWPVYFTHGDRRSEEDGNITLGKLWLVSRLKSLFQTKRIRLPPNHAEAQAMMQELLDYEIRVDARANDTYGSFKVGAHDDLVTALGLAVQDESIVARVHSWKTLENYYRNQGMR